MVDCGNQTVKITRSHVALCILAVVAAVPLRGAAVAGDVQAFLQKHCAECHDAETKKGGLDLTALRFDSANATNFSQWVLVHDRVLAGEMPPKKKARPAESELAAFTQSLSASLAA